MRPATSSFSRLEISRCAEVYRTISFSVSAFERFASSRARSKSRRSNAFFDSRSISRTFVTSTSRFFASATRAAALEIALWVVRYRSRTLFARSFVSFIRRSASTTSSTPRDIFARFRSSRISSMLIRMFFAWTTFCFTRLNTESDAIAMSFPTRSRIPITSANRPSAIAAFISFRTPSSPPMSEPRSCMSWTADRTVSWYWAARSFVRLSDSFWPSARNPNAPSMSFAATALSAFETRLRTAFASSPRNWREAFRPVRPSSSRFCRAASARFRLFSASSVALR